MNKVCALHGMVSNLNESYLDLSLPLTTEWVVWWQFHANCDSIAHDPFGGQLADLSTHLSPPPRSLFVQTWMNAWTAQTTVRSTQAVQTLQDLINVSVRWGTLEMARLALVRFSDRHCLPGFCLLNFAGWSLHLRTPTTLFQRRQRPPVSTYAGLISAVQTLPSCFMFKATIFIRYQPTLFISVECGWLYTCPTTSFFCYQLFAQEFNKNHIPIFSLTTRETVVRLSVALSNQGTLNHWQRTMNVVSVSL